MFQMGIGMLAQQRSWQNRGLAGVAQGAMQGMSNWQQAKQFQQQQQESLQMQQMRVAQAAQAAAEEQRKAGLVEARNALVTRLRGTAPQPRPFAFKPKDGDADVLNQFNEVNFAADAIAAGGSPDAYMNRTMQLEDKKLARADLGARAEEDRKSREKIAKEQVEARLEVARNQGATATQIAQMRLDMQRQNRDTTNANREFSMMARNRETELKLADDFERESKPYKTIVSVFAPMEQYIGAIEKGTPATPAGDRALVFSYARTLDPNDRVGVKDVQDIQKLGNIPEQWGAALRGLAAGRSLPARVRTDMFAEMKRRFDDANKTQLGLENEFSERTSRYQLDPKNVARPLGRRNTIKFSDLPK